MHLSRNAVLIGAGVVLGACGVENRSGPAPPHPSPFVSRAAEERIALALAVGMNDESVRLKVRDDMRASPWTSHKLELWTYVAGEGGSTILQAIAKQLSSSPSQLVADWRTLPPYDLSVRNNRDRMSWHGDLNYIVAVAPHSQGEVAIAYGPNGGVRYSGRRQISGRG